MFLLVCHHHRLPGCICISHWLLSSTYLPLCSSYSNWAGHRNQLAQQDHETKAVKWNSVITFMFISPLSRFVKVFYVKITSAPLLRTGCMRAWSFSTPFATTSGSRSPPSSSFSTRRTCSKRRSAGVRLLSATPSTTVRLPHLMWNSDNVIFRGNIYFSVDCLLSCDFLGIIESPHLNVFFLKPYRKSSCR